jgi:murein DD-endopeptidase MepM/ murein hydrolase activator NlpD/photosystem II stability/assembly factor-like uncharacterized protein
MKMKRALKALILILITLSAYCYTASANEPLQETGEGAWTKLQTEASLFTSLEITPWGVMAGERDSRTWLGPHNGLWISKDLGDTWERRGLAGRGVTDIKYFDRKIYATTYYVKDNKVGLFYSDDGGKDWLHLGNSFSASRVSRDRFTIYLGGYSHGLWISRDGGLNWEQKIGTGWYGPEITVISSSDSVTFASTINKTFRTTDHGVTWEEVGYFANKGIKHILINKDLILAGSSESSSLYRSTDLGLTWEKLNGFGNYRVGGVEYFSNAYYAGKLNPDKTAFSIYQSHDKGSTWTDTGLSFPSNLYHAVSIKGLFSTPSYLYTALSSQGIYRYQIPDHSEAEAGFLSPPWDLIHENDLIERITAYFDHQYPLLGYNYYSEPKEEQDSTLNFLGIKAGIPHLYYSSHDGYDYALPYGTPIKASAEGFASYSYCGACGHTIKIGHLNGYQTTYMHLKKEGLVVSETNKVMWVGEGSVIGKVGMTGNTTGPHLHFSVLKDLNNNQNFLDDWPSGLVDPYGWQNPQFPDPWPLWTWQDTLGTHKGSNSFYMWKKPLSKTVSYINREETSQITLDNMTLKLDTDASEEQLTILIRPYSAPRLNSTYKGLAYVSGTSVLISLYDHYGTKIQTIASKAQILVDLDGLDLSQVLKETLKVYRWNDSTKVWNALPTMLDLANNFLVAETDHFSNFVVLGTSLDTTLPTTEIEISGSQDRDWYIEFPTISFNVKPPESRVFYSIGDDPDWQEYKEPVTAEKEGIYTIQFRAMGQQGNIEPVKDFLLKVDTENLWKTGTKMIGTVFTIIE